MTAAAAWYVLGGLVVGWVVPVDLWLHYTGRHTMTRQMHDWIYLTPAAQFIIPAAVALVVWFITHEVTYHPHSK